MTPKNYKHYLKGFTLIEILVVISIIALLSVLTLSQYKTGQRSLALQRSAHKLAQDIRRAQEMAMSARELPGGGLPSGGYGVCFDKVAGPADYDIFIYADTTTPEERYDPGDQVIENIVLEKEVKVKEVKIDSLSPNRLSVNFKPPDPKVKLRGGVGDPVAYDETRIIICLKTDENKTRTIRVNKAGLIYVSE